MKIFTIQRKMKDAGNGLTGFLIRYFTIRDINFTSKKHYLVKMRNKRSKNK
jgi:hypothetical protein